MATIAELHVEPRGLGATVRDMYWEAATTLTGEPHVHTARQLAGLLGYDRKLVDRLPDPAVESFAGVVDPLTLRPLGPIERVVDAGSGAGFDCLVAAHGVGHTGRVVGVEISLELLGKARETARQLGLDHVEFREGIIEALPVEDGWEDVVMSNGALGLVADKRVAMSEIFRLLRPGGTLAFADITVDKPVNEEALHKVALRTDCTADGLPVAGWQRVVRDAGFVDRHVGPPVNRFRCARTGDLARAVEVAARAFLAHKPH